MQTDDPPMGNECRVDWDEVRAAAVAAFNI